MKLYQNFSLEVLEDRSQEAVDSLAVYLSRHFDGSNIDYKKSISYVSEQLCKLSIDKIERVFMHNEFQKVIYILCNEKKYTGRDIPIILDVSLRHAYANSNLTTTILLNLYERTLDKDSISAFLFLASHISDKVKYGYEQHICQLILKHFHRLSTNQLNRVFDNRNRHAVDLLKDLYPTLVNSDNIHILIRLYLLSYAFFPQDREWIKDKLMECYKESSDSLDSEELMLIELLRSDVLRERFRTASKIPMQLKNSKIKVAICISGQLRGYKKAFPSWEKALNLKEVDYTFFVSCWDEIGGKDSGSFMYRYFPRQLSERLHVIHARYGDETFRLLFKNLLQLVHINNDCISEDELKDFYSTEYVKVESDKIFESQVPNVQKMCYKIEDTYQMALDCGKDFDLFVRIRPDKKLDKFKAGIDWNSILKKCSSNVLLCDFEPQVRIHQSIAIGDQVQIATKSVADVAFRPYSTNIFLGKLQNILGFVKPFAPHNSVSMPCMASGIGLEKIEGVVFSDKNLMNAIDQISLEDTLSAIYKDYEENKDVRVKEVLDFGESLLRMEKSK